MRTSINFAAVFQHASIPRTTVVIHNLELTLIYFSSYQLHLLASKATVMTRQTLKRFGLPTWLLHIIGLGPIVYYVISLLETDPTQVASKTLNLIRSSRNQAFKKKMAFIDIGNHGVRGNPSSAGTPHGSAISTFMLTTKMMNRGTMFRARNKHSFELLKEKSEACSSPFVRVSATTANASVKKSDGVVSSSSNTDNACTAKEFSRFLQKSLVKQIEKDLTSGFEIKTSLSEQRVVGSEEVGTEVFDMRNPFLILAVIDEEIFQRPLVRRNRKVRKHKALSLDSSLMLDLTHEINDSESEGAVDLESSESLKSEPSTDFATPPTDFSLLGEKKERKSEIALMIREIRNKLNSYGSNDQGLKLEAAMADSPFTLKNAGLAPAIAKSGSRKYCSSNSTKIAPLRYRVTSQTAKWGAQTRRHSRSVPHHLKAEWELKWSPNSAFILGFSKSTSLELKNSEHQAT
ncbi:hypothetical protein METBIDRAFT_116672 [Metschnikowia bicuspidata var. bicuspidata NRRL YB-4993]|uniref:Uncharacterized protein n=1 Tax=Metschnikowia bicuspidata var. bicuspidata NRRL YB-4993 TaxID=869754 RepID=A0A1A0HIQ5_9ASCO|nr:hypothetical protein METBIDRAFT_116672 [Metschnikowia bicuspidata var. bicuspidata NRRL YB-4993]OBA24039.1 hypothetical protein METBIDRAFT_116672 [Metschnikowia bicuspidata var. bicuspidata NRRL YB-4993]